MDSVTRISTDQFNDTAINYPSVDNSAAYPNGCLENTVIDHNNQSLTSIENKKVVKEDSHPFYIVLLIFIVIGIVINLFLLYRIDIFGLDGDLIPEERKTYASILGIGVAIILGIIFFGGMFLIGFGTRVENTWIGIAVALFVAFIISFLMGWLVGIYVGIDHLWLPDQNLVVASAP